MITKQQLIASISEEIRIVRHLAKKVPPGTLDWRPTPGQRSTLDLLRYLSTAGTDLTREMLSGSWDTARVTGKAPKDLRAEDFDRAMERQDRALRETLEAIDDRAFLERKATLPTGETTNLGAALVAVVLRALVGYRMQLFLYAKMSGNASLSTYDCWFGVDTPA